MSLWSIPLQNSVGSWSSLKTPSYHGHSSVQPNPLSRSLCLAPSICVLDPQCVQGTKSWSRQTYALTSSSIDDSSLVPQISKPSDSYDPPCYHFISRYHPSILLRMNLLTMLDPPTCPGDLPGNKSQLDLRSFGVEVPA